MLFHLLASFFHLFNLLFVARLLGLALFPLLVGDASHNFHRVFGFLLLLVDLALVMSLNLLLVSISLLLDHALLQPLLESPVAFLLLDLFLKSLLLLFSKLLLLFESLSDKLALLPLVHLMGPVLILLIQGCLLDDHLLKEILLGFEDEHLAESFLMLLHTEPGVMTDLLFGNFSLFLPMHVEDRLVNAAQMRPLIHFV